MGFGDGGRPREEDESGSPPNSPPPTPNKHSEEDSIHIWRMRLTKVLCSSQFHVLYGQEHRAISNSLGKFIAEKVNPRVEEWERAKQFPARELFPELAKFGVFCANKPKAYGGLGLDFSYSLAIAEALGDCVCGGIPMAACVQSEMATPALLEFGSEQLKREFLAPSIAGQRIACLGVSEPGAGSDVAAIETRGRKAGSDLIIKGRKMWITNGQQADWICLLIRTDCSPDPHANKSLVCVNMAEPGVHVGPPIQKLGMHCSDTVEILFDDVRVPVGNIIGEEGRGFLYQMSQFQNERLVAAAVVLRPLERIIAKTAEYALSRPLFGARVFDQQTVKYQLAAMSAELDAFRALLYQTTLERVNGGKTAQATSKVKYLAGQLARSIPDKCLQFWGGLGYCWDNEVSRLLRDLRLISIGAGCDEVMLAIIAKDIETMGLRR